MASSVLVIARHYYPTPGAATNRLGAAVGEFVGRGRDVTVITRQVPGGSGEERGPHGERIIRVAGDSTSGVGVRRGVALLAFPILALRAAKLHGLRPDIVIADPPPTVGLAVLLSHRLRRAVKVYYYADSWADLLAASDSPASSVIQRPVRLLEGQVVKRTDVVITVTDGVGAKLRDQYPAANVQTFVNGVDGSIFEPAGPAVPPEGVVRPYFLYAGNYGEAHGASIFAKAAERCWEKGSEAFDIVFIGYGSDVASIHDVANRWPGRLHLVDPSPPDRVANAYRASLAGLASLKDRPEIKHMVSVKALASVMCGAPLIYVGSGSFSDEVKDRKYGMVADFDTAQVAAFMETLAEYPIDELSRRTIAATAAENYDNRFTAVRLVQYLEGCASDTRTPK